MEMVEDGCGWFPLGGAFSFHFADFTVSLFWGVKKQ
jgi:hypothetical protein